jgi:hypothetical protein
MLLYEDFVYRKPASRYFGKWRLSSSGRWGHYDLFIKAIKENTNSVHFLVWSPGEPESTNPSFKKPYLSDEFHQWTANYGGELIPQPSIKVLRNLIKSLFVEHTYRFIKD